ncbi:MAG: PHP domain protein [Clostridia bacterium 41_269]|nr:MAG: PHP domain protein [Clostridia bacterium 41_269]
MKNLEIALLLGEIADLLEIKGENQFKIRAYRRASRAVKYLKENIEDLKEKGSLTKIPGVGKGIAAKIEEYLDTGEIKYYTELKKEVHPELLNLIRLPGVGIKTAKIIHEHFPGIDIELLKKYAEEGKIRALPGLGPKTEQNLLRGIDLMYGEREKYSIGIAKTSAEIILDFLNSISEVERAEIAGSVRRGKDLVGDLDLVISAKNYQEVVYYFEKHPHIQRVEKIGDQRFKAATWLGIKVDIEFADEDNFIETLYISTGSEEHIQQVKKLAEGFKGQITKNGIFINGSKIFLEGEKDIFSALGLPYIEPELREGRGEVEAAKKGRLPLLVKLNDIKGDLQVHSTWSDGMNSIEEMVQEAVAMGYSYIAITDHSKSLGIANGLSEKRLMEQWEEIEKLREKYAPFKILRGIEVDILSDGRLDFDEEVLKNLDLVIASIHSGFKQDRETITKRIISALENPYVDIIAHPTGRILGKRPPYDFDFERVLEKAAETNTVLEINASPDRLDLDDEQARAAKEMGIKIAVNTDAHERSCLNDIQYGVITARRAWLQKEDIINCMEPDELLNFLAERKKGAMP